MTAFESADVAAFHRAPAQSSNEPPFTDPEVLAVVHRIERAARQLRRIRDALAHVIDVELFHRAPPGRVTFTELGQASSDLTGHASWCDGLDEDRNALLFGSRKASSRTTAALVEATAEALARAAQKLKAAEPEEQWEAMGTVEEVAKLLASGLVEAAHSCGYQLLVVDVARFVGVEPIPFPEKIRALGHA